MIRYLLLTLSLGACCSVPEKDSKIIREDRNRDGKIDLVYFSQNNADFNFEYRDDDFNGDFEIQAKRGNNNYSYSARNLDPPATLKDIERLATEQGH